MCNELYGTNQNTVRYGTETILALCHVLKKALETQLTISFMQNIFVTCWLYIAQQNSSLLSF